MTLNSFCENLLDESEVNLFKTGEVGAVMISLGLLYFIMSVIIIYFIKLQERYAQMGDDNAVKSVIFPIFVQVLWFNAVVNIYVGFIAIAFDFEPYSSQDTRTSVWVFAIMWGLQHCVVEGVAILLMQKGLGSNAAIRSGKVIVVWGFITMFIQFAIYAAISEVSLALDLLWNVSLAIFYMTLWLAPQRKLYRRPAAIFYAKFWTAFRLLACISTVLFHIDATSGLGTCVYTFGLLFPFAIFEPIVLYYTLLLDSKWWQGLDIIPMSGMDEIKSPLQGVDLDLKSAQSLAESMDTLGVSASRHKAKAVRLLNFASITLEKNRMLGTGSFSKVYPGKYKGRKCAVKLIFTIDITQDIISRIAAEAQILSSIRHPNVVEIIGVSVLPPSVCILLELCSYGSLGDVIGGTGFAALGSINNFMKHFVRGSYMVGRFSSRGLNLSWTDRLYLAVGCARGLAALHKMGPQYVHRDIKSFNFLVDEHLNAKISDLELGISDDLLVNIHTKQRKSMKSGGQGRASASSRPSGTKPMENLSLSSSDDNNNISVDKYSDFGSGYKDDNLQGDEILANWAAPEVIRDVFYSQASDVYSFGLVLWEIISGMVPYSDVKRQDDIREKVLNNIRPEIPASFLSPPYDETFAPYIEIIAKCWNGEPLLRPSIQKVLEKLEFLYKSRCYEIVHETDIVDRALEDNSSSSLRSGTLRTLWKSAKQLQGSTNPLTRGQVVSLANALNEQGSIVEDFVAREEAWILCLPDHNLTVLWVSPVWEDCFGLYGKDIIGTSFLELSCFVLAMQEDDTLNGGLLSTAFRSIFRRTNEGNQNKAKIEAFFQTLRDIRVSIEKHSLLELVVHRFRNASTNSNMSGASGASYGFGGGGNDNNGGMRVYSTRSIFSIHAYPIASMRNDPNMTPNSSSFSQAVSVTGSFSGSKSAMMQAVMNNGTANQMATITEVASSLADDATTATNSIADDTAQSAISASLISRYSASLGRSVRSSSIRLTQDEATSNTLLQSLRLTDVTAAVDREIVNSLSVPATSEKADILDNFDNFGNEIDDFDETGPESISRRSAAISQVEVSEEKKPNIAASDNPTGLSSSYSASKSTPIPIAGATETSLASSSYSASKSTPIPIAGATETSRTREETSFSFSNSFMASFSQSKLPAKSSLSGMPGGSISSTKDNSGPPQVSMIAMMFARLKDVHASDETGNENGRKSLFAKLMPQNVSKESFRGSFA